MIIISIFIAATSAHGQQTDNSGPPALSAIREADLKQDLFKMAGDSMRGRRAGTIDEMKAASWLAERAREAGLQPAGENGTYFQFFPLFRATVGDRSTIQINGKPLALWKQVWVTTPVDAVVEGPVQWLKALKDTTASLRGKIVAMDIHPPNNLPAKGMSLWDFRYALYGLRRQQAALKRQGVKAIVLVADSITTQALPYVGLTFRNGSYELKPRAALAETDSVPVMLVRSKWKKQLQRGDGTFSARIKMNKFTYPSVNVVAKAPGTDSQLKDEYVLFSGHIDHEGVGLIPVKGDSIWNGADDNASTSVALLAIGRAWEKHPGRRSALFVWHGAEERGLFGSRYFIEHPTMNENNIVAVLNGDLIGRNAPDSAALLGVVPPHRNSRRLTNDAMAANRRLTHFKVDTTWDAADHPEHWYYRSDHLPYARADIPSIFFSTLLHPDYHTPQDNPDRINITKLAKMTKWMYATGWNVSQNHERPAVEAADQ